MSVNATDDLTGPIALIGSAVVAGVALVTWFFLQIRSIAVDPSRRRNKSDTELGEKLCDAEVGSATAWENRTPAQKVYECYQCIYDGAHTFLYAEYKVFAVYAAFFAVTIALLRGLVSAPGKSGWKDGLLAAAGFLLGSGTSILAGFLGMKIAVYSNARTAIKAQESLAAGFNTAFRGGAVMGFIIVTLALFSFVLTLGLFYTGYDFTGDNRAEQLDALFKAVAGFGVGAASFALFSRVGGGIYTKAADVGADLVGKVEQGIPEDDPRNPATIADNVGDNVGDIAGMGADLFSSMTGSMIAALVLSGEVLTFNGGENGDQPILYMALAFPICIHAAGILCCALASLLTYVFPVNTTEKIKKALQLQEFAATLLVSIAGAAVAFMCLPAGGFEFRGNLVSVWAVVGCLEMGIWGGLSIGLITEYYTSYSHRPVQDVANSCKTGAATNIISGLALGYMSTMIPIIIMAILVFVAQYLAGIYGIAIATIGILSCLATSLSIDAYGPICDNAGGIAEMSDMGEETRDRTDALDAAGNTTAAIGKGFAIASACLVGLALIGAFTRSVATWDENTARQNWLFGVDPETGLVNGKQLLDTMKYTKGDQTFEVAQWRGIIPAMGTETRILDPLIFSGLLIGAMLPYIFTAMTMKSVGKAALAMVEEVRRQFREMPGIMEGTQKPEYAKCITISTKASLSEMILPGLVVILTPLITGFLLGTRFLTGVLVGSLLAGIQFAIAQSNTGGAWDNAKKYIEANMDENLGGKGSDDHKAAVIGDTVGDPLKDTSGPAINVLIKNMGLIAVLFVQAMVACEKSKAPKNADGSMAYNPAGAFGLGGYMKQLTPAE